MKETRVATRYAKSLLDLSNEKGELEGVCADMQLVASVCAENHELELLLKSPIIKTDKKQKIIQAIFEGKLNKISSGFIEIVIRKRREYMLQQVAIEFVSQYKRAKNIVMAEVTTAIGLDDTLRKKVLALVKGESVEIVEKVDKNLIGGLIVRVGDKQVDASIIRQINELRKDFAKNPYVRDY